MSSNFDEESMPQEAENIVPSNMNLNTQAPSTSHACGVKRKLDFEFTSVKKSHSSIAGLSNCYPPNKIAALSGSGAANYCSTGKVPVNFRKTSIAGPSNYSLHGVVPENVKQSSIACSSNYMPFAEVPLNVNQTSIASSSNSNTFGAVPEYVNQASIAGPSNSNTFGAIPEYVNQASIAGPSNSNPVEKFPGNVNQTTIVCPSSVTHLGQVPDVVEETLVAGPSNYHPAGYPGNINQGLVNSPLNSTEVFKRILRYKNKIEKRFYAQPGIIVQFYEIVRHLQEFSSQHTAERFISIEFILQQIHELFNGHNDLIEEFDFICRNMAR